MPLFTINVIFKKLPQVGTSKHCPTNVNKVLFCNVSKSNKFVTDLNANRRGKKAGELNNADSGWDLKALFEKKNRYNLKYFLKSSSVIDLNANKLNNTGVFRYKPGTAFPTRLYLRPEKTQLSLRIHTGLAQSLLST